MLDKIKLPPAAQTRPTPSKGLPLSGLRVTVLTTAWAGPMAGRILACLGAEVVHIEPANNLDSWRSYTALMLPKRYPDQQGGERRYNRAALFNSQNTDKLSFAIGSDLTFYSTPSIVDRIYGTNPVSWKLFFRVRPGKMDMQSMHGMNGNMNPGEKMPTKP